MGDGDRARCCSIRQPLIRLVVALAALCDNGRGLRLLQTLQKRADGTPLSLVVVHHVVTLLAAQRIPWDINEFLCRDYFLYRDLDMLLHCHDFFHWHFNPFFDFDGHFDDLFLKMPRPQKSHERARCIQN